MTAPPVTHVSTRSLLPTAGWAGIGFAFLFCWFIALGAGDYGELTPQLFLLNAIFLLPILLVYLRDAPVTADRLDRLLLLALLLFLLACVLSQYPRQSLDAALAVCVYVASLFVLRKYAAREPMRDWMVKVLLAVSGILTVFTAARWGLVAVEWMAIADWEVLPPLNLELSSQPWGHRHDMALLVAMLYPAWWMRRPSLARRVAAVLVGILVAFIMIIDGSRALWGALALSTLVVALPFIWRRGGRPGAVAVAGIAAGALILAIATGLAGAVIQRLSDLSSVGFRTAMWHELLRVWAGSPVAGEGPGSFPWVLQQTGYFDSNSFGARHADSAPIQVAAEAGLLGLVALGIVIWAVVPRVWSGRSPGAAWALSLFAFASIAANPTDFPFMMVPAIVWTAYAVPRDAAATESVAQPIKAIRYATFAGAAIVAGVFVATTFAAVNYMSARVHIFNEEYSAAAGPLNWAVTLDPGMAVYLRERGVLGLTSGQAGDAIRDLRHATSLNPSDHVAWRLLAISLESDGQHAEARSAISRAVELRAADPRSWFIRAQLEALAGEREQTLADLALVVHAWPEVVGAEAWSELMTETGFSSQEVLASAAERWAAGLPIPEAIGDQGVWLATMADRPGLLDTALDEAGYPDDMRDAAVQVFRCESASTTLDGASAAERRTPRFWALVLRDSATPGPFDKDARWMVRTMTGHLVPDPDIAANALNGAYTTTRWGYRRAAVVWPGEEYPTPAPEAGYSRWMTEPARAVRAAGLDDVLPRCLDS